jgi:phytoene desaturase
MAASRAIFALLTALTVAFAGLADKSRPFAPEAAGTTIAVIGAGFSGLTAALEARQLGYNVIVLDKLPQPGGRAQREVRQSANATYAFDTGPSWYWMPEIFDEVLARYGQRRSDHYNITLLDPAYRLVFEPNQASPGPSEALNVPGTREGFLNMAKEMDPSADIEAFFADAAEKYDVGTRRAIWEVPAWPLPSWLLSPGLTPSLITKTLAEHIADYISHPRLRAILEWPSQFLGMDAASSPSLYSLITYAGHALGTWMPLGPYGMQAPAIALYNTAKSMGVQFHLGTEVARLESEGRRRISRVHTVDGRSWDVDGVIAAADYHHVEQKLLPPELRRHSDSYWEKQVMTPTTVIFKLCIAAPVPTLPTTHSLWFDDMSLPFYATSDAYMKGLQGLVGDTVATSADYNVTSVFLLVPMMDNATRAMSREAILSRVLARLQIDASTVVCGAEGYGPKEYVRDYHAFRGNAFGHANLLSQSMWLKVSNQVMQPASQLARITGLSLLLLFSFVSSLLLPCSPLWTLWPPTSSTLAT